jgi:c-di-GMP-related signal transduction protein
LKKSLTDPICYEEAYLLIDKYFSNFPYHLIKSKNHSLLLRSKLSQIPPKLENKLKNIFPNEEEYDFIIAELLKSPPSVFEEFINLYDDIKLEMNQLDFDKHGILKLGKTKNK